MAGWTNAAEVEILEYWFRGTALTSPAAIGLFITVPTTDAGAGGTEATGGAYARVAFAASTTNWAAASGADPSTIANAAAVSFTTATGTWGGDSTVKGWGYWDQTTVTGSTLLAFGTLASNKTIGNGDKPSFAIGALVFKLGDPGDSY